jgi:hypothetical protein
LTVLPKINAIVSADYHDMMISDNGLNLAVALPSMLGLITLLI